MVLLCLDLQLRSFNFWDLAWPYLPLSHWLTKPRDKCSRHSRLTQMVMFENGSAVPICRKLVTRSLSYVQVVQARSPGWRTSLRDIIGGYSSFTGVVTLEKAANIPHRWPPLFRDLWLICLLLQDLKCIKQCKKLMLACLRVSLVSCCLRILPYYHSLRQGL